MLPRVAFTQNESYLLKVAVFFLKEAILLRKITEIKFVQKTKISLVLSKIASFKKKTATFNK